MLYKKEFEKLRREDREIVLQIKLNEILTKKYLGYEKKSGVIRKANTCIW